MEKGQFCDACKDTKIFHKNIKHDTDKKTKK